MPARARDPTSDVSRTVMRSSAAATLESAPRTPNRPQLEPVVVRWHSCRGESRSLHGIREIQYGELAEVFDGGCVVGSCGFFLVGEVANEDYFSIHRNPRPPLSGPFIPADPSVSRSVVTA